MSTNFYLDSADNDAGHLGKWTAGYFMAYAPAGIDSFEQWAAQMDGRRIFAENGREATKDELIGKATARVGHKSAARSPNRGRGEFMDKGALFLRNEFC